MMRMGTLGVRRGASRTLAIAGEHLYYLSNQGVTRFTGGYPTNIHTPFGEARFTEGFACSDGLKYYLCARDQTWGVYVYDTKWDAWMQYAEGECKALAADQRLYGLGYVGNEWCLWTDGKEEKPDWAALLEDEEKVASKVEFNPFTGANWANGRNTGNPSRKGTSKLQLRLTLAPGTELTVSMRFDNGPWEEKARITLSRTV